MRRKFVPFDEVTVMRELDALSSKDFFGLTHAMKAYQESDEVPPLPPASADPYRQTGRASEAVWRLKHKNTREFQGRLLFYLGPTEGQTTLLYDLVVYKKES